MINKEYFEKFLIVRKELNTKYKFKVITRNDGIVATECYGDVQSEYLSRFNLYYGVSNIEEEDFAGLFFYNEETPSIYTVRYFYPKNIEYLEQEIVDNICEDMVKEYFKIGLCYIKYKEEGEDEEDENI